MWVTGVLCKQCVGLNIGNKIKFWTIKTPCYAVPSLRTLWLIFYRRGRKEGTESIEIKYYFELLLGLRLLMQFFLKLDSQIEKILKIH